MFDLENKGAKPITPIPLRQGRPAYSFAKIKQIKMELESSIGFKHLGTPFTDAVLVTYCNDICTLMNWSASHIETIYQSLYPYLQGNPIFTPQVNKDLAIRVSGGYLNLHAGEVFPVKNSGVLNRWLGLEVVYAQLSRKHNNRQLIMLKFNVTAGNIAGTIYSQEFPISNLSRVFKESLKFNKYKSLRVTELFGMQFMGYLTLTDNGDTQFTQIATNSYQDNWNRDLRSRRDKDCQHNLPFDCVDCPVGADRCNNATHLISYELDDCANTLLAPHKGYIDTNAKTKLCISCTQLQATGNLHFNKKHKTKKDEPNVTA